MNLILIVPRRNHRTASARRELQADNARAELQSLRLEIESAERDLAHTDRRWGQRRALDDHLSAEGQQLLDAFPLPALVLAPTLQVLAANHAFAAQFKVEPETMLDRPLEDLGGARWDFTPLLALLRLARRPSSHAEPETASLALSAPGGGNPQWFRASAHPLRGGSEATLFCCLENVTQAVRNQQRLHTQATALSSVRSGLVEVDRRGTVRFASLDAARLARTDASALVGRRLEQWLQPGPRNAGVAPLAPWAKSARKAAKFRRAARPRQTMRRGPSVAQLGIGAMGPPGPSEHKRGARRSRAGARASHFDPLPNRGRAELVRGDGSRLPVAWRASPLSSGRVLIELRDAARLRQSTRALLEAEAAAAEARLAAVLAHEINNPLAVLRNTCFLLRDDPSLGEHTRRLVAAADAVLNQLAGTVKATLDRYALPPEKLGTAAIEAVRSALEVTHARLARRQIHVTTRFRCHGQLTIPPTAVRKMLVQLIARALEACPVRGRLWVGCFDSGNGRRPGIRFLVGDSGPGHAPQINLRRGGSGMPPAAGGDAVLWLVAQMARRYQGMLHAKAWPEPDAAGRTGTCFGLFLPCEPDQSNATSSSPSRPGTG